ncbi:MAG: beta-N-acetylhexosaminidase [Desulfobulbaceae bacterium]|nr:beta-N-acetylhexosaminidase [Desulfobulbaceae bacterium]
MWNRHSTTLPLGQLFVLGFRGEELRPGHWLHHALQHKNLGGVVLFDRNVDGSIQNISSPVQLRRLTADLQNAAGGGLLIAVDQEGGKVCRLKATAGFCAQPAARDLGNQGLEASKNAASSCAKMLKSCGINLNFAPVVDLDYASPSPIIGRYGRSFGTDPENVYQHALAWIKAHHAQGVACCLKHFPGHGSARSDTHHGFVDASATWQPQELEPYRRLIAAGFEDAIMTAHLVLRQLDACGLPATLSRPILTGLLRQELGFQGVVCTDDLQMGAIRQGWSYKEAVQKALLAGADMLVIGNNLVDQPDALQEGVAAIEELLVTGQVKEERILASVKRIERLRASAERDQNTINVATEHTNTSPAE